MLLRITYFFTYTYSMRDYIPLFWLIDWCTCTGWAKDRTVYISRRNFSTTLAKICQIWYTVSYNICQHFCWKNVSFKSNSTVISFMHTDVMKWRVYLKRCHSFCWHVGSGQLYVFGPPDIHTMSQKTTPNSCPYIRQILTDFQNSLTSTLSRKFTVNWLLKIPPHLKRVATLPCKILTSKN